MNRQLCGHCGLRVVARRGLGYLCYKNPEIRDAALFRGRDAVLPEEVACQHCKKRKIINGRRGLCLQCWRIPLVRELYRNGNERIKETPLTEEQKAVIAEHVPILRKYVMAMARRWQVLQTDREELFSAAMENVCRRGARLRLNGDGVNVKSFLIKAAIYGMKHALRWGPLKKPNTVYLAHDDTDGRTITASHGGR